MRLNKPYTNKEYADFAVYCNENNLIIEDRGDYLESVEHPEPTIEEQNEQIRLQRQARYVAEADPLRLDWDESAARNEQDANDKKKLWLDKKDEIRKDLPYLSE